jgi:hypothetical protein
MSNDILIKAHEAQIKADAAFTSICFGTLALSIQFSPKMGNVIPEILLYAWLFLSISCVFAWRRHVLMPIFYNLNAQYLELKKNNEILRVEKVRNKLEKLGGKTLPLQFAIQQGFYFGGVFLNLVFASANYLESIPK